MAPGSAPFRARVSREEERASKREALLVTAVRMFNANGFHATSLDDVATALRVSKPTIYYYLGNKEQVLLECLERGLLQLRAAVETVNSRLGTGLERLRAVLLRYGEVIMGEFGRCVIRTGDEELSPEGLARFKQMKKLIDLELRALICKGMADGSIVKGDEKMTAFTIAGALNWPARWADATQNEDARTIVTGLVDILTFGLIPRH